MTHNSTAKADRLLIRVCHRDLGTQAIMILAGTQTFGTQADLEFTLSPELLTEMARDAPNDWRTKNIEVVIETKVVKEFRLQAALSPHVSGEVNRKHRDSGQGRSEEHTSELQSPMYLV